MTRTIKFALALLVLSCGLAVAQAQPMQNASVYVVKNLLSTPQFVALENGYWAEQGLNVQIKMTAGGRMVVQALQAGDAQFGHVAISGTLPIARAGGDKLVSIMPYYNAPDFMGKASAYSIIGRRDRGIELGKPDTLTGRKIGFTAGTDEFYLKQWLRREKVDIAKVTLVSVLVEDMPVTVGQGVVDAVVPWEPYGSQIIRELGPNAAVMSRGEAGLISDNVGVVVQEAFIRDHADVAEKFATGIAAAAQFVREHPTETAEIVGRYLDGLNQADALEGLKHMVWDPRISVCTIEGTIRSGNALAKTGQIKMDRAFVKADFYDTTVYDRVMAKHPEYFAGLPPLPTRLEDCKGPLTE